MTTSATFFLVSGYRHSTKRISSANRLEYSSCTGRIFHLLFGNLYFISSCLDMYLAISALGIYRYVNCTLQNKNTNPKEADIMLWKSVMSKCLSIILEYIFIFIVHEGGKWSSAHQNMKTHCMILARKRQWSSQYNKQRQDHTTH